MKTIHNIPFKGKSVLIRVDFNVPLDNKFNVSDDSRIVSALPTIKKVISEGGRAIIMSHLGRPKNGFEECFSLKHTVNCLSRLLSLPVGFCNDCIGETAINAVRKMSNGDVLILENLRFYPEEKKGDAFFAKKLSKLADIYINDAFGSAHRKHASTSIIANCFPNNKYFGYLLASEILSLKKVLNSPIRPFTAILGGAKISDKIDVITNLFNKVDNLIVGGGMAYTFSKAMGGKIGKSLVDYKKVPLAKFLIEEAKIKGVNLLLPVDSLNGDSFNNNANTITSDIQNIDACFMGLDIGKKSVVLFSKIINESKTIIWNGPMGVFEMASFSKGTKKIGSAVCQATKNGAFSLVGGGDLVAAVKKFNLDDNISYISTGGGAMLEYLEGKRLPGIISIEN